MATKFLINNVTAGTNVYYAGSSYDTVKDAADIALIASVGGNLFASTAGLIVAAEIATGIRLRGGDPVGMEFVMIGAVDFAAATAAAVAAQATADAAVPKASVQTGSAVLVAGAKSIATANITAGSVVMAFPAGLAGGTPGSLTTGTVVVGAPGSFIITSSNVLDTSTVRWLVIG